jgi:hypothetical protein
LFAAELAGSGAAPARAQAGKDNDAQASRQANRQANGIDRNRLCDTKAPLNMCATANRNRSSAFAHASCRIASFRRHRVSKVCHRGGVLLAFAFPSAFPFALALAASQNCLPIGPLISCPDRLLQIRNKTMGVNLVRLSRTR